MDIVIVQDVRTNTASTKDWLQASKQMRISAYRDRETFTKGDFEQALSRVSYRQKPELTLEWEFRTLVESWRKERGATSSVTKMAMCPSYQRIIGLGLKVVPLLLRELERDPDYWFWALKVITGEDPVPPESRGKLREMTAAWLDWGRKHQYLW